MLLYLDVLLVPDTFLPDYALMQNWSKSYRTVSGVSERSLQGGERHKVVQIFPV